MDPAIWQSLGIVLSFTPLDRLKRAAEVIEALRHNRSW